MPDNDRNTKALPLLAAYPFAVANGLDNDATRIRNMQVSSSMRRAHIVQLFREKGVLDKFVHAHWTFGTTPRGATKLRYYERLWTGGIAQSASERTEETDVDAEDGDAAEQRFALESDLRDFLAWNLNVLESGLRLYERDGRNGIEFPVDAGFIDILAVDRSGKLVVIELKLSRGRNRALGQLTYYMSWVDDKLSGPCRGYIVASEITDELRLAVRRVPGVSLAQYRVMMSIETLDIRGET